MPNLRFTMTVEVQTLDLDIAMKRAAAHMDVVRACVNEAAAKISLLAEKRETVVASAECAIIDNGVFIHKPIKIPGVLNDPNSTDQNA